MDKHIRELFNDAISAEGLRRFRISPESARLLDGFESFIYECERDGSPLILRFSHDSHRTPGQVGGEVEWINFLSEGGIPAARAIPSPGARLVEAVPASDGVFSVVSFMKAPGGRVEADDWNPQMFNQMGRITGRMHALTKHYQPSTPELSRMKWDDEDGFAERYLPAGENDVIAAANELLDRLRELPREKDAYGLIHYDFHRGNFFVHRGRITLFDFDDCQYHWFAADIAIALFYAVPHHCESREDRDKARRFYECFMDGYCAENTLGRDWLRRIPLFLKQREIDLYVAIHRSFDTNNLDSWCTSFMENRKTKILNDVPYVDIDFV